MAMSSIWAATAAPASFPSLDKNLAVDVAIVGGGITGVTTALHLAAGGKRVALLEAGRVGCGSTGHSTGNLYATVGQGLAQLESKWGAQKLGAVVRARARAVDRIEQTIRERAIECAFGRVPWWLHQSAPADRGAQDLDRELDAARRAGLQARIEPAAPLPWHTGRALAIAGQAQFQPLAYVRGLAQRIASTGCAIFEHTPAIEIDASAGFVATPHARVRAAHIVLATHTPKGFDVVQTEIGPYREYGVAAPLAGGELPGGIFWSTESPRHSVRAFAHDGRRYVVVVGHKHKTGQEADTRRCYAELEEFVRAHFDAGAIEHRWSAQGYYPADGLPYVGASAGAANLHIATGFSADGLTYGALAGELIADAILGRANDAAAVFDARRFDPGKAALDFARENANVAAEYVKDYASLLAAPHLGDLAPGDGRVVTVRNTRCAVHRTSDGKLMGVSPFCTHLRCVVHWNRAEQSWDCPCHGSRFRPDGSVIEGPALEPLERLEEEGA